MTQQDKERIVVVVVVGDLHVMIVSVRILDF